MVMRECDRRDDLFSDGQQAKQNKMPCRKGGEDIVLLFPFISVAVTKHSNKKQIRGGRGLSGVQFQVTFCHSRKVRDKSLRPPAVTAKN